MTIENTTRSVRTQGNDATTVFDYDFLIPTGTLVVILYDATAETYTELAASEYSATGLDNVNGGTVTYPLAGTPITPTQYLIIRRDVPYTQPLDIANQGGFFADTVMEQLDRTAMMTQQLAEVQARSLITIEGDEFSRPMPIKSALAGNTLAFDANGEPTTGPAVGEVSAAGTYAQQAIDAAAAAATSETNAAASAAAVNLPPITAGNVGKTFYVKRDLSGYEFVRPVMVDLVQTYGIDPDDNVNDQSTTLNNALADLAGKGVIAFIRPIDQTYDANVGIGSTIIIPSGVILQSASGYGGDNQSFDDFAGVRFTWVGGDDGKMVWFNGVHHAGLRGVRMEANGRTGMIGAHFSSEANPPSSYTHMKHFSMLGFHKALVFGDPADAYDSGSLPGSIMQAQADSIEISDFTIFGGNAADTGIHINGRNVLQSSVIRQGNIQACNFGVHIHNTNGDFTLQHLVVGSAVATGADKTAFRFESTLIAPPKMDGCETEGTMDYAVHDSSANSGYQYSSVWTNNYFNNSILIDGNARIASIGNSGGANLAGKTWVVGGTAKVVSIFDTTNLPASKISPWTTTGSGKVMELGDRNDVMELAGVEKLPTVTRQAPTYVNSWVDVGGTDRPGGYYKDLEGVVHLEGSVTGGTAVQIFTLPVGYRPTKNVRFAVSANDAFGEVTVDGNGGVYLTIGTKTNVYLDGISFRAA